MDKDINKHTASKFSPSLGGGRGEAPFYMRRCIQLAQNGLLTCRPNPMVGAVIVHDGHIIGEGYHIRAGEGHAEVNAFASVRTEDEPLLPESTMYVSLEPCAHYGKTPPCAELIIRKGVRRVVVGCVDPFARVQGRGIQMLRDAGIEVTVGVLEDECRELNKRFFTFHEHHRPYILLKWAQTADGFIDDHFRPVKISTPFTQMLVHKLRAESDAILVVLKNGEFYITNFDTNNHYEDNILIIEKWQQDKVWSAVLYDADQQGYPYVKRFLMEASKRHQNYLGDNPNSQQVLLTDTVFPRLLVTFGGADENRPPMEIDVEQFIGVKGFKAKGKRITTWQIAKIEELEPTRFPEEQEDGGEDENADDNEDLDPDAGKSQQQVIDEITGQLKLNLFEEDE